MAMLQVLSEMICAEEFLGLVAFTEFMGIVQVGNTVVPVRLWLIRELFPAVPADV